MLGGHTGDGLVPSIAPALTTGARCPVTIVRSDHRPAAHGQPVVVGVEDVVADAAADAADERTTALTDVVQQALTAVT
jgi:hypothetical protein